MKAEFKVTVNIPIGCSKKEICEYIEDAVAGIKGPYNLSNPIFDLDRNSIKITASCQIRKM